MRDPTYSQRYTVDRIRSEAYSLEVWIVLIGEEFKPEFKELPEQVQDEIASLTDLLEITGPLLGRPRADTLKGSKHANMKELRFDASDGVWRVAFAFDIKRRAVLLVAGDKSGGSQERFYRELISKADIRFDAHLVRMKIAEEAAAMKQAKTRFASKAPTGKRRY